MGRQGGLASGPDTAIASIESEMAVIGGVMLEPSQMTIAATMVDPSDFYDSTHGKIYEQLTILHDAGKPIGDMRIVIDHIKGTPLGQDAGIAAKIAKCLSDSLPGNVVHYANEVVRTSRLRRLLSVLNEAIDKCYEKGVEQVNAPDIADWMETRVQNLGIKDEPAYLSDAKIEGQKILDGLLAIECGNDNEGGLIETGIPDIDIAFGGVRASNYIVIAAAPGCGKSALAKQIANDFSLRGRRILFVSLEMSASEVSERLWSERCEIDSKQIANGSLSNEEKRRLMESVEAVEDEHFLISTPMGKDARWSRIAATAKLLKHTKGIDAMFLDYLQLIEKEHAGQTDYEKVTDASRGVKELARTLGIPIFVLSQFNSAGENCQGEVEPQLAHLRDSRAIGQDADSAWFLQRQSENIDGNCDVKLIVAKWRGDKTNRFRLMLEGKYTRIVQREDF